MIARLATASAPPPSHTRSNHRKQSHSISPLPRSQGWQSTRRGIQADRETRPRKDFRGSAGRNNVLSACAVCLGRHPHPIVYCSAACTWNDAYPVSSKRKDRRLYNLTGQPLCGDWQWDMGCPDTSHNDQHSCSGCGLSTHGANSCPRTQQI